MSTNVLTKVSIYETDGVKVTGLHFPELLVESHSIRREFVVIKVGKHSRVTVLGRDLESAIRNAMNRP